MPESSGEYFYLPVGTYTYRLSSAGGGGGMSAGGAGGSAGINIGPGLMQNLFPGQVVYSNRGSVGVVTNMRDASGQYTIRPIRFPEDAQPTAVSGTHLQHRGILKFTTEALAKILGLPPNHYVRGADYNFGDDTLSVFLQGPGCPEVREDTMAPTISLESLQEYNKAHIKPQEPKPQPSWIQRRLQESA